MPSFKTNIDLQTNQLLNAVMHNLPAMPSTPVEGQMYYDTGKKTAYIWNGSYWAVWGDASLAHEVRQFSCNITSPVARTGSLIIRLYENLTVMRVDSHISSGFQLGFSIEHRSSVNLTGTMITAATIQAVYSGTETTVFSNPVLSANNWLYLNITDVSGTVGMLTITISCSTM
jgi:hypothetical protein